MHPAWTDGAMPTIAAVKDDDMRRRRRNNIIVLLILALVALGFYLYGTQVVR
jgi:hypothetical protein